MNRDEPSARDPEAAPQHLMTCVQAAEYLQFAPGTLANWRVQKKGPPYLVVCGRIRYDPAKVEAWVQEQQGPLVMPC